MELIDKRVWTNDKTPEEAVANLWLELHKDLLTNK